MTVIAIRSLKDRRFERFSSDSMMTVFFMAFLCGCLGCHGRTVFHRHLPLFQHLVFCHFHLSKREDNAFEGKRSRNLSDFRLLFRKNACGSPFGHLHSRGCVHHHLHHGGAPALGEGICFDNGRGASDVFHSWVLGPLDWSMVSESEKSSICGNCHHANHYAHWRFPCKRHPRLDSLDKVPFLHFVCLELSGEYPSERKNS